MTTCIVSNRFEGYSDGIQVNGGNRNYIGSNVFTDNALALSMTGEGNVIDGNIITGNAVGVALRPAARMGLTRITRNLIHHNGKDVAALLVRRKLRSKAAPRRHRVRRSGAGARGLCRGARRRRAGRSGQAHAKSAPTASPTCQGPPNHGIAAPVIDKVMRDGTKLTATGRVQMSVPLGTTIELFGNRNTGDTEGEIFLGETRIAAQRRSRRFP